MKNPLKNVIPMTGTVDKTFLTKIDDCIDTTATIKSRFH